jgi:hypothetical protein
MKKTVFVDTAAWLALVNKSDMIHQKARKVRDSLVKQTFKFMVTDYVLVEIANAFSRPPYRSSAIKLITTIQASNDIQIIAINKEIYSKAWSLYSERPDKEWSFTDCTSFIVMKAFGIKEAFTTDHHFEQSGFSILLK